MLEQLFGSRTRTKLLHLFLENIKEAFYVREICRTINERIHSVRRELENLEKFGLLISKQEDQKKYYFINPEFPILNELKSLIDKSKVLAERKLGEKAKKIPGVKFLTLTGMFTDEEQVSTDVLFIGKVSRDNMEKFISELKKVYRMDIRYTYFTMQEYNLRRNVTDKFLYSILNSKKIVLVNKLKINE
ncbi:winged helix-turn-helix transcriptional regulator [bacterium]|jgi:hypothetical protein|nr:winged helix-turn-helix transcriptional regulator [bacterium]MBT4121460.1 winged helix-turn-helix transcriptional regulator [bacterium]MBT4335701.1 winged helix-turn-helix transcriptional regulator [bacterium]MBT4495459.1 winged helix-turn-helix transcriptional regulator [bacterium]MBT4764257.1 winged helix-turn-helix transcriptional regulator [bacterium]